MRGADLNVNQLVTKPQVLGVVGPGMLRFTALDRKIEYVRTYGDIAVVVGAETGTGQFARIPGQLLSP